MYWLYALVAVTTFCLTAERCRHVLHPQFLITAMLQYMFLVDFLVRGESEDSLAAIPQAEVWFYQAGILLVYLAIWAVTFIHSGFLRSEWTSPAAWVNVDIQAFKPFSFVAHLLTTLELLKRLSLSDWSLTMMIEYSLGPRASGPWAYASGNIGDGNFVYHIVSILLPLSGMVYAYHVVFAKGATRLLWLAAFVLVLTFLIADGSRTPVYLVMITLIMCIWQSASGKTLSKLITSVALLSALAVASAVMHDFRSVGLNLILSEAGNSPITVYHQDDNYYRALNALHIAATTPERWSDSHFFATAVVNPIPRFFWEDKPILLSEFWGNYKSEWVTISFLGELAAMYGASLALFLSVLVGFRYRVIYQDGRRTRENFA